jgi:hypothetical protein
MNPDSANRPDANGFEGRYRPAVKVTPPRGPERGRAAVWQARLALLVMINIAQLWTLSATVEAALARHYDKLIPLVVASGVCWIVSLTLFFWWKPASRRITSSGNVTKGASANDK